MNAATAEPAIKRANGAGPNTAHVGVRAPILARTGKSEDAADGSNCGAELLTSIPPVMWFIRKHMRSHRTKGLSVPQFRTLILVEFKSTQSLSDVAEKLGTAMPTASRIVAGLVNKGYLSRCECPGDRRRLNLSLTHRGRTILHAAREETRKAIATELSGLSDSECQQITDAMGLLARIFGSAEIDSGNL